jgi:hypothetical protein
MGWAGALSGRADSDHCDVCGGALGEVIYTATDQVTHEKVKLCPTCATWPDVCFICGLPVRKDFIRLPDGRFLCARDARTAVLDEREGRRLCAEVRDDLDRLFSRFMTFPDSNIDVSMVDRVSLLAFKVPGNDFQCPNLLGYIQPEIDRGQVRYAISVLSALPRAEFKATCAHEYTHAWVFQNVSPERRKTLDRDAHEGFCELVAYLLMDAEQETGQKRRILANAYTRGQIDLFIRAEQQYGFDEVLDWVKYGRDGRLSADEPGRVREIEAPRREPKGTGSLTLCAAPSAPAPENLAFRGVLLAAQRPVAFINDQALAVGDSRQIRLARGKVTVRCLAIGAYSVRVRILETGQEEELRLPDRR